MRLHLCYRVMTGSHSVLSCPMLKHLLSAFFCLLAIHSSAQDHGYYFYKELAYDRGEKNYYLVLPVKIEGEPGAKWLVYEAGDLYTFGFSEQFPAKDDYGKYLYSVLKNHDTLAITKKQATDLFPMGNDYFVAFNSCKAPSDAEFQKLLNDYFDSAHNSTRIISNVIPNGACAIKTFFDRGIVIMQHPDGERSYVQLKESYLPADLKE